MRGGASDPVTHVSLYRKYRPKTFDEVVGQQHIERTLRNAVAEGSVAHAYLFAGPRGTGKTTTARLLAKALLCDRPSAGEPDGTCEQCIDVAEGRHPDVLEIDAASNTGVELIRANVVERVHFAPTRGRYKVYIIDEVHMLSIASFNAILKTLEEPPAHVVFVLCTTHPNKVPATIHSRCQRFDFKRISVEDIADHLRFIAEAEGFVVDRGAITLIARHADGGMRDAITMLEQLVAFTGGEVTADDVEGLIGDVDSAQLFEIGDIVARRDIAGGFRWLAQLVETGSDLSELVKAFTSHVRDLYVVSVVEDPAGIVDRTRDEIDRLRAQAAAFGGPDRIARLLRVLGELAAEMRWSSDPRLSIEVALARMADPRGELTLEALAERIEALERGEVAASVAAPSSYPAAGAEARGIATLSEGSGPSSAEPSERGATATPGDGGRDDAGEDVRSIRAAGPIDRGTAKRNWQAVLLEIKRRKPTRSHTFAQVEVDVDEDGRTLVLEFPKDQEFSLALAEDPEMRELVRAALAEVFGTAPPFRYQLGRGAVRPAVERVGAAVAPRVDVDPEEAPPEPSAPGRDRVAEAAGLEEPAHVDTPAPAPEDLMSVLKDRLGATIIAERPIEEASGAAVAPADAEKESSE